ncbi:MAG: hypothetical protein KC466_09105 [Myxococcales bacterium]|nr:hypothetical protein [Myxococcales bacterium]
MLVLGITHPVCWNTGAAILRDGELLAMAEEERFIRYKHAPNIAPLKSIEYCLKVAGATLEDVDVIAVGWDYEVKKSFAQRLMASRNRIFEIQRSRFQQLRGMLKGVRNKIVYLDHHISHAASAYLFSGFDQVNVLTIDGSGGDSSGLFGYADGARLEEIYRIPNSQSWGNMYTIITEHLGFAPHSAEGKVMGLAAFGTPQPERFTFIDWSGDVPEIDPRKFRRFRRGLKRWTNVVAPDQEQKDLAATVQWTLEQMALKTTEWLARRTGCRNFALAGGCALNCSMNGFLLRQPHVENIFVQPAAYDVGTALGAAAWVHAQETGKRPVGTYNHVYLGPEFSNAEIEAALKRFKISTYRRSDDIAEDTAELLAQGELVGWFQGRMEVGPRALGGRSMLANPGKREMKDKMNAEVKGREGWRPFAPSFLADLARDYVTVDYPSPFMILAFQGKDGKIEEIPAATHVDKTVRVQTVLPETNPVYHAMIRAFHEKTGLPAVLNTSFNIAGQPIVCTPHDAISTFFGCGLDKLAVGDYLVWK